MGFEYLTASNCSEEKSPRKKTDNAKISQRFASDLTTKRLAPRRTIVGAECSNQLQVMGYGNLLPAQFAGGTGIQGKAKKLILIGLEKGEYEKDDGYYKRVTWPIMDDRDDAVQEGLLQVREEGTRGRTRGKGCGLGQ